MNEPETYKRIYDGGVIGYGNNKSDLAIKNIPLYTSDQLHKRVKMTQEEFNEFNSLYSQRLLFSEAMDMLGTQGESERYVNIRNRIYTQYLRENMDSEVIFAQLWQLYNPKYPQETIEIVSDMKWFVRSKEPSNDGSYLFRSGIKDFGDYYYTKDKNENKIAYPFDTKEEAEKWTNPLTEAVQLPVEGE